MPWAPRQIFAIPPYDIEWHYIHYDHYLLQYPLIIPEARRIDPPAYSSLPPKTKYRIWHLLLVKDVNWKFAITTLASIFSIIFGLVMIITGFDIQSGCRIFGWVSFITWFIIGAINYLAAVFFTIGALWVGCCRKYRRSRASQPSVAP